MSIVFSLLLASLFFGWYAASITNKAPIDRALFASIGALASCAVAGYGFLQENYVETYDFRYLLGFCIAVGLVAAIVGAVEAASCIHDGEEGAEALPDPYRGASILLGVAMFISSMIAAGISTTLD